MHEAMNGATDIGHGVLIVFFAGRSYERVGLFYEHPTPDGGRHIGSIRFDLPGVAEEFPGRTLWQIHSWEPLTVTPSLLCERSRPRGLGRCGHHGWIREGLWVPC